MRIMSRSFLPVALVAVGLSLSGGAALAKPAGCPPGLAKKAVPCVPPGQAKKWAVGAILPGDILWQRVDDWQRYGLPRPGAGEGYVRVDDEVLLLGLATRVVLQSFGILN